jgi:hypothetical protein
MKLDEELLLGETFKIETAFGENQGVWKAEKVIEPRREYDEPSVSFTPLEGQKRPHINIEKSELKSMIKNDRIEDAPPDPRRVHESRSEYAQKQDLARDARITTDPDQYASDSNSYDFPGIDTGPTFRDVQDDFDEESFLDTIL